METSDALERINRMWLSLAEQFEGTIPEMVHNGHAKDAITTATYAEACFWKSTGEAETHDVREVLGERRSPQESEQ